MLITSDHIHQNCISQKWICFWFLVCVFTFFFLIFYLNNPCPFWADFYIIFHESCDSSRKNDQLFSKMTNLSQKLPIMRKNEHFDTVNQILDPPRLCSSPKTLDFSCGILVPCRHFDAVSHSPNPLRSPFSVLKRRIRAVFHFFKISKPISSRSKRFLLDFTGRYPDNKSFVRWELGAELLI